MALVIERLERQGFWVGDVHVLIRSVRGKKVKVAIQAPLATRILRDELIRIGDPQAAKAGDDSPPSK